MEENKKMIKSVICKDCDEPIELNREIEVGEVLECENCGAEMEVISLEPLEISLIEEEK
jgi:alpha-aminoadipate/glutamate carrier protein LysW